MTSLTLTQPVVLSPVSPNRRVLSRREAASYCGVSDSSFCRAVKRGDLPALRSAWDGGRSGRPRPSIRHWTAWSRRSERPACRTRNNLVAHKEAPWRGQAARGLGEQHHAADQF